VATRSGSDRPDQEGGKEVTLWRPERWNVPRTLPSLRSDGDRAEGALAEDRVPSLVTLGGRTGTGSGPRGRIGRQAVLPKQGDEPGVVPYGIEPHPPEDRPQHPLTVPVILFEEIEGFGALSQSAVQDREVGRRRVRLGLAAFGLRRDLEGRPRTAHQGIEERVVEPLGLGGSGQREIGLLERLLRPTRGRLGDPEEGMEADRSGFGLELFEDLVDGGIVATGI
jgi:hypothetical protein